MSTTSIQRGFWIDYNRAPTDRYQILVSDQWAGMITSFIAVLITSTSVPIFNIISWPLDRLSGILISRWSRDPGEPQQQRDGFFANTLAVLGNLRPMRAQNIFHSRRRVLRDIFGSIPILLVLVAFPIALIVASVVSVGLATNSTARSISNKCGIYTYRARTSKTPVQFLEFEHRSETESSSYAINYYGSTLLVENCPKFFNQSISYTTEGSVDCPFRHSVCLGGEKSAYRLTTGLVPGSVLGINSLNPFFFSRTMTCSPLPTNDEYVRKGKSEQGLEQYEYWYGSYASSGKGYTFANPFEKSPWEIKGYSVGIRYSLPWTKLSPFKPRDEFTAGSNPITMFFISTNNVKYSQFRSDPIFPADTATNPDPQHPTAVQFFNNSTRAGVLGCVDEMKICRSAEGPCWTFDNVKSMQENLRMVKPRQGDQNAGNDELVAYLLQKSLDLSTAFGATRFRGAEALDAQSKIAHQQSLDLAPQQWQVEAEKIFRTSLARIQLNAYDIIRGTASSFTDYHNDMPKKFKGICRLVSIRAVGYKNINTIGLFGTVLAVVVLWLLGWKKEYPNGNHILIAVLLWKKVLKKPFAWIWRFMETIILKPGSRMLGFSFYEEELGQNQVQELVAMEPLLPSTSQQDLDPQSGDEADAESNGDVRQDFASTIGFPPAKQLAEFPKRYVGRRQSQ